LIMLIAAAITGIINIVNKSSVIFGSISINILLNYDALNLKTSVINFKVNCIFR
jgi:uncharacterized protein YkvS